MGECKKEKGKKKGMKESDDTMTVSKRDLENLHTKVESVASNVDEVVKRVARIEGAMPHLATKEDVTEKLGKHVVEYHKTPKSIPPSGNSILSTKVITAIIVALGALTATVIALAKLL